jgi:hypothetical protein
VAQFFGRYTLPLKTFDGVLRIEGILLHLLANVGCAGLGSLRLNYEGVRERGRATGGDVGRAGGGRSGGRGGEERKVSECKGLISSTDITVKYPSVLQSCTVRPDVFA